MKQRNVRAEDQGAARTQHVSQDDAAAQRRRSHGEYRYPSMTTPSLHMHEEGFDSGDVRRCQVAFTSMTSRELTSTLL